MQTLPEYIEEKGLRMEFKLLEDRGYKQLPRYVWEVKLSPREGSEAFVVGYHTNSNRQATWRERCRNLGASTVYGCTPFTKNTVAWEENNIPDEPQLVDVISCLILDASVLDYDIDEYVEETGCKPSTYAKAVQQTHQFARLLGGFAELERLQQNVESY